MRSTGYITYYAGSSRGHRDGFQSLTGGKLAPQVKLSTFTEKPIRQSHVLIPEDKIISGILQGIGRAIAKQLVACGAQVLALSRTQRHLDSLVAEEPTIKPVCVDLADWDAARAAVEAVGPVHALVNNAAVAELAPFLEVTPESFDRQVLCNQ